MTRFLPFVLLAACASPSGGSSGGEPLPQTRIVMKQYYNKGSVFIVENLAGRDIVELRSRPVPKGGAPVAWISDEDMRKTLKALKKYDFEDYARPRPADPKSLGARGELTVYGKNGQSRALIRRRGQSVKEAEAYQDCVAVFQQVWGANRPQFQAITGDGEFGVKRADFKRGQ
jgi:hypothetical protein